MKTMFQTATVLLAALPWCLNGAAFAKDEKKEDKPRINLPQLGKPQGQGNANPNQGNAGQGQGNSGQNRINLPKLGNQNQPGNTQQNNNQGGGLPKFQPRNDPKPKVNLPNLQQGQGNANPNQGNAGQNRTNLPKLGNQNPQGNNSGIGNLPNQNKNQSDPKKNQNQNPLNLGGQGNKGLTLPGKDNKTPKLDLPNLGQGQGKKDDKKNLGNTGILNNPNLGNINKNLGTDPNKKGIQLPQQGNLTNNNLQNALKHQPAFKVGKDLKLNNNFKDLKLGDVHKLPDGKQVKVSLPANDFAAKLKAGDLNRLVSAKAAQQVNLKKQFELHQKGDVVRQMNLNQQLVLNGGWQKRHYGLISPVYTQHCFSNFYCGPAFYPQWCWFPKWNPWVNWCWHYPIIGIYDPRPIWCRPIFYDPCPTWVVWDYPVWNPMPVVACGTWVDVPPVVVDAGLDLQLLAVRFVDPGHPDQQYGPRFRAFIRNNSNVAIEQPFNVLAYASNERTPGQGPEAGVRIKRIDAGEIQSVDIRLPFDANILGRDAEGRKVPFQFLHVIVDSHRELPEAFEANNGAVLARGDILPVDPAIFAADPEGAPAGATMLVAGEGFGPEAGQVLVNVGGLELQGEILGWYDLGVQVRLPELALAADTNAEVVVIRGDTAASNPLTVTIKAAGSVSPATALLSP